MALWGIVWRKKNGSYSISFFTVAEIQLSNMICMLINFHYSYILSGFANAGTLTIFLSVGREEVMTPSFVLDGEREREKRMFCWLWGESPGVKRHCKSSGTLTICRSSQDSETRKISFSPWVTLYNLSPGLFFFLSICLSFRIFSVSVSHPDTHKRTLTNEPK